MATAAGSSNMRETGRADTVAGWKASTIDADRNQFRIDA